MNLIHIQGLNCYFNSVITIAASLGLRYEDAFATLWSETDFAYDRYHNVFSSKRMLTNLETMGAKRINLSCASRGEREEGLSLCQEGAFIIVGMDAFYIPWSPIYQALHDPHYYFAQKERPNAFCCFDPTYNQKHIRVTPDDIISHAYDMCRVERVPQRPLHIGVMEEAREIIGNHPHTQEKLLCEINACADEKRKNAGFLAKYIDTLISNRRLFTHYLQNTPLNTGPYPQFFDQDFFSQWGAVKNGLYKASLLKNNESVLYEVSEMLTRLIEKEIAMAKQIIAKACTS